MESRSAAGGSCERALCGELEGSDADTKAKMALGPGRPRTDALQHPCKAMPPPSPPPPPPYQLIMTSGTCASHGYAIIDTRTGCQQAAEALAAPPLTSSYYSNAIVHTGSGYSSEPPGPV